MARGGRAWPWALGALLLWPATTLSACSDDTAGAGPVPVVDAGVADASPDGATPDAGPVPGPCEPGALPLANGSCEPAGVPPEACGVGFEPDGERGCAAVLPAEPCAVGTMAVPGETVCREVAPCGTLPWEGIPTDGTTQHVDGAYGGAVSDGSADQPWTTIQDAVDAAAAGAVVAIAAGSYVEALRVVGKPVELWGTCPAQVEIAAPTALVPAIYVSGATGTEVHQLAITGPSEGVVVRNSDDVLVDRVWIHHTADVGLGIAFASTDTTSVDLRRSLLEATGASGADVWHGAELRVEETVIRDARGNATSWGWGLYASSIPGDTRLPRLEVRRSLLERNSDAAIVGLTAELVVEDTAIRDTLPSAVDDTEGSGIIVAPAMDDADLSTFELRRSTVQNSHTCGVCAIDAATSIEHVTVRDTAPRASDDRLGYGMMVASEVLDEAERPSLVLRQSTVQGSHTAGINIAAVDAVVEGLLVRNTAPEQASEMFGRGVAVQLNPATGVSGAATITGTRIEGSHEVGLLVLGAVAVVEGVVIAQTRPRPSDGKFGRGLIAQLSGETLAPSTLTMRHSLVDESHEAGLYVAGADATVTDSVVRRSHRRPTDAQFGDGIIGTTLRTSEGTASTALRVERCRVEQNDRAGVASFGASVALGANLLGCNALDINGETYEGVASALTDLGDNLCGCESLASTCQLVSTGLSPPEPL